MQRAQPPRVIPSSACERDSDAAEKAAEWICQPPLESARHRDSSSAPFCTPGGGGGAQAVG